VRQSTRFDDQREERKERRRRVDSVGEAIKKEKKSSSRKGVRVMEMDRSVAFCIRASRPYLGM
jgi:hypothetical protein